MKRLKYNSLKTLIVTFQQVNRRFYILFIAVLFAIISYNSQEISAQNSDGVSVFDRVTSIPDTKIFNWILVESDYRMLGDLLDVPYSIFVPTDDVFKGYIDPVGIAKEKPVVLDFWYNENTQSVNATMFSYDTITGNVKDSLAVITDKPGIKERLLHVLKTHILSGQVNAEESFYRTLGNSFIHIKGLGTSMMIEGGGNIENETSVGVKQHFKEINGDIYVIDKLIASPVHSVYKILSETPQFQRFFALLNGFKHSYYSVFELSSKYYDSSYSIRYYSEFNYTLYVPTNEAIQKSVDEGLIKDWDQINSISDAAEKERERRKLLDFCAYHFQDHSVFIGDKINSKLYQTSTLKADVQKTHFDTPKNKFYRIEVGSDGSNIILTTEQNGTANVVKSEGLFNIMTYDYVFGTTSYSNLGLNIATSSTTTIHQIDDVLRFE